MRLSPKAMQAIAETIYKLIENMLRNQNDQKRTTEVSFRIKVNGGKDASFEGLREELISGILRYQDDEYNTEEIRRQHNVIYKFIQQKAKQHLGWIDNVKVLIADYNETASSLIIDFTLVVLHTLAAYGAIRSGIDYFLRDLRYLLDRIFPRNYNVRHIIDITSSLDNEDPRMSDIKDDLPKAIATHDTFDVDYRIHSLSRMVLVSIIISIITLLTCIILLFGGDLDIDFDESNQGKQIEVPYEGQPTIKELEPGKDYFIIDDLDPNRKGKELILLDFDPSRDTTNTKQ